MNPGYQRIAMALALTAVTAISWAADPRPCELLTAVEVASILGGAPMRGPAEGPDVDKELATTSWACGWTVQQPQLRYLGVSAIRSRSVAEATQGMKMMLAASSGIPEGIQLQAVPGPGDQAAWGTAEEGAVWATRKGEMIIVIVMGMEQKNLESQREPLRKLLAAALGRL
jgi:hypothetical protein